MKIIFFIYAIIFQCQLIIGQKDEIYISDDHLYGKLKKGIPKKVSKAELNKNGNIIAKGTFAVNKRGVSNLKVGYWKEYYENGVLKKEGNYKLDSYINCGVGGAFRDFYFYHTGVWKFYSQDGELKYELTYKPVELKIDTNCDGGDKLIFGIIEDIPLKYWGDLTSDKIFDLQKTETEDDYNIEVWTPLNGQIFVESKIKTQ